MHTRPESLPHLENEGFIRKKEEETGGRRKGKKPKKRYREKKRGIQEAFRDEIPSEARVSSLTCQVRVNRRTNIFPKAMYLPSTYIPG